MTMLAKACTISKSHRYHTISTWDFLPFLKRFAVFVCEVDLYRPVSSSSENFLNLPNFSFFSFSLVLWCCFRVCNLIYRFSLGGQIATCPSLVIFWKFLAVRPSLWNALMVSSPYICCFQLWRKFPCITYIN